MFHSARKQCFRMYKSTVSVTCWGTPQAPFSAVDHHSEQCPTMHATQKCVKVCVKTEKSRLDFYESKRLFLELVTGVEPATSGLWEIQSLCVSVLFCWAWWCYVPRLGIDFVPCVQKGAIWCWPVPSPFGGKSVKRILTHTVQINAQLWFHWEMRIPTSRGFRTGKAQRTSI